MAESIERHQDRSGGIGTALDTFGAIPMPDDSRGQRVLIIMTLAVAFPQFGLESLRQAIGWTRDEMDQVLADFGTVAAGLELV